MGISFERTQSFLYPSSTVSFLVLSGWVIPMLLALEDAVRSKRPWASENRELAGSQG